MNVQIPYGKDIVNFQVDEDRLLHIISPTEVAPAENPTLEVEKALKAPIDGPTIREISPKGKTIAIAVDDITRVTPTHILLPPILKSLQEAGAKKEDIKVIAALGTHRPMTEDEMRQKYGVEIMEEYNVVNHAFNEESALKYMGTIAGKVPVWINKEYIESDIRIVTGNLIPHFNAGWGGGAKILLPGLAGEETVGHMHVHSAITTPNGVGMEENPTRQLIDAFAEKVGIHLLVNSVITRKREIVKAFAGHFKKAHRRGVKFAKKIYGIKISRQSDITITSSHPADIEFWQGEKGLFSADLATRIEGGIIELTPCPEGLAVMHPRWSDYLSCDSEELNQMYKEGGVEDLIALGIAMNVVYVRERHPIYMISDGIPETEMEKMKFKKFSDLEEASDAMFQLCGTRSKINILTYGGETYPIVE
ncbi:nickel-dependent lactate racemase family protein [[Eubacterium] cellulosolvens]